MVEAEAIQPDGSCIDAIATILAENAEMVQVFIAPIKENLDHEEQVGPTWYHFAPGACMNERADASQDDTQLIDVGMQ